MYHLYPTLPEVNEGELGVPTDGGVHPVLQVELQRLAPGHHGRVLPIW